MAHASVEKKSAFWFHLGAIITVTAWGVSFISTKICQGPPNDLTPVEVYVLRFTMAYLLVLAACHKKFWSNSLRDELLFATCGLCGGSIYFIAENTAIQYTLVSNVALITTTAPLITTMLVGLIYKSERPKLGTVLGSLLAFLGVGCVIFNSSFNAAIRPLGDMLALAAALGWAIYSIVLRKLNALYSVMFISRKTFFYGLLTALPFLAFEPGSLRWEVLCRTEVWANLLFLGVFASMVAYIIWAQAVKRLGAVKASNYLYFSPIVTLVASQIFLDEAITVIGLIGCALILLGVWLSDLLSRPRKKG
ncbi:MAG: DMT family transporter [Bacteroidales bacterium]|nr:DMT family transporter [Bacteroidales bacterium]MCD8395409.1 DMT family transporter [Bacteroidales bacterium]